MFFISIPKMYYICIHMRYPQGICNSFPGVLLSHTLCYVFVMFFFNTSNYIYIYIYTYTAVAFNCTHMFVRLLGGLGALQRVVLIFEDVCLCHCRDRLTEATGWISICKVCILMVYDVITKFRNGYISKIF